MKVRRYKAPKSPHLSRTEEKSPQNEGQINMISQITTMLKTINYFTTRHLTIYLITNKLWVFEEVKKGVEDLEHGGNIK